MAGTNVGKLTKRKTVMFGVVEDSCLYDTYITPGNKTILVKPHPFYSTDPPAFSIWISIPDVAATAIMISGGLDVEIDPVLASHGEVYPLMETNRRIIAYYKGTETRIEGAYLL